MKSVLEEDNNNDMLDNSNKSYFNIHIYDQKGLNEFYMINNEKEKGLPLLDIDEEEHMLINQGHPQDIIINDIFQPNINNIFEDSKELSPIIYRHPLSKNLKDLEFPFNPEIDDFFIPKKKENEKNENIQTNFENKLINENNEKNIIEKEEINNDNIKNINTNCIKEKKLFNVSNLNLFNSSRHSQIRYIINDNIHKKPKPKKVNKCSFHKPFKISNSNKSKIRKRKEKPDDIRKKIKAKFLKSMKNCINEKLMNAKSKELFDFLPQCFICSITKKGNDKSILNMTFKDLMSTDFTERYKKKSFTKENSNENILKKKKKRNLDSSDNNQDNNQDKNPDKKKYIKNVKTLKYLEEENNKNICEKVHFDSIQKMTFTDLFNEYLKSNEFEEDILKLKEKENNEYINDYIIKAFNFIKYFSQP